MKKHLNASYTNFQQYTIRISYSANQSSCGIIDLLVGKCGQSISWRIFSHRSESCVKLLVVENLHPNHIELRAKVDSRERGG